MDEAATYISLLGISNSENILLQACNKQSLYQKYSTSTNEQIADNKPLVFVNMAYFIHI